MREAHRTSAAEQARLHKPRSQEQLKLGQQPSTTTLVRCCKQAACSEESSEFELPVRTAQML